MLGVVGSERIRPKSYFIHKIYLKLYKKGGKSNDYFTRNKFIKINLNLSEKDEIYVSCIQGLFGDHVKWAQGFLLN